jgi:hypothetical protein
MKTTFRVIGGERLNFNNATFEPVKAWRVTVQVGNVRHTYTTTGREAPSSFPAGTTLLSAEQIG